MKKDGIGKLYCRICGYKYQKRLGPLDKQVDIYCAMIDEAEALNSRKQNEGIGLVKSKEEEDEDGRLSEQDEERYVDIMRQKKPAGREEEKKGDDEGDRMLNLMRKSSSLSASMKIAEMGLGRAQSDAVPESKARVNAEVSNESQRTDFNKLLLKESSVSKPVDEADEDSDSDDLF